MLKMWRILSSLAILYGLSGPIIGNFLTTEKTPMYWMQIILGCSVGIGGLCLTYFHLPPNLIKFTGEASAPVKKEETMTNTKTLSPVVELTSSQETLPEQSNLETMDMNALFYLSERCSSDPDALQLCKDLTQKFFDIHHKVEVKEGKTDVKS